MTVVKHVWMTTFISVILAQQILSSRPPIPSSRPPFPVITASPIPSSRKIRSIYPGSPEQSGSAQLVFSGDPRSRACGDDGRGACGDDGRGACVDDGRGACVNDGSEACVDDDFYFCHPGPTNTVIPASHPVIPAPLSRHHGLPHPVIPENT